MIGKSQSTVRIQDGSDSSLEPDKRITNVPSFQRYDKDFGPINKNSSFMGSGRDPVNV